MDKLLCRGRAIVASSQRSRARVLEGLRAARSCGRWAALSGVLVAKEKRSIVRADQSAYQ